MPEGEEVLHVEHGLHPELGLTGIAAAFPFTFAAAAATDDEAIEVIPISAFPFFVHSGALVVNLRACQFGFLAGFGIGFGFFWSELGMDAHLFTGTEDGVVGSIPCEAHFLDYLGELGVCS